MMKRAVLIIPLMIVLVACQQQQQALTLQPLPGNPNNNSGVSPPRTNGTVGADTNTQLAPEILNGRPMTFAPARLPPQAAEGGDITLKFVDADIREIVKQVLGSILQVNYTIDPAVHGNATIETVKPLARKDVLPILETLLNQNGATIVQSGTFYRVIQDAAALATPNVAGGAESSGTQLVPLRYVSAKDLAKVLEPFISSTERVIADPTRNVLLVTAEPTARAALLGLIKAFDVDLLANQSYALFPVNSGDPGKAATELQKVFETEGDGHLAGVLRVVPMERVNAVLVVSAQAHYIDDARRLFQLIDQVRQNTARSWHVYYVQNGQSSDLANVLQRAFTPGHVTTQVVSGSGMGANGLPNGIAPIPGPNGSGGTSGTSTGGSSVPGGGLGSDSGSSGSSGNGLPSSGFSSGQAGGMGSDSSGGMAATESLSETDDKQASGGIRILDNKQNNALLIYATPAEQSTIDSVLGKVDILPLQVLIDATIAEVTLNDQLQYGTQFFFKGGGINGVLSNASSSAVNVPNPGLLNTFPGFILSKVNGGVNFALSALQQVTNVRVLSSPQVMALDNQPARLQVGDIVPYLTQTSQSTVTTDSPVISSINYRETGVILQVTPRVNNGGLVTLDISQEVSDVDNTVTSTIGSPTFLERKFRSRVVVQDGQTIGLAGLIRDTTSRGNSGIPFLKDIPVLGNVFSTQNNSRERTELLVMLTPHVMQDQHDARALTEDLRQKLIHAGLVPQQLQRPAIVRLSQSEWGFDAAG